MTSSPAYLQRPAPSGLADVVEVLLDRGVVVDAYARVSLLGIELLTVDARVVVASVETYLRFAEATNRLDLPEHGVTLPEVLGEVGGQAVERVAEKVVEKKVRGVADKVEGAVEKVEETAEEVVETAEEVVESVEEVMEGVAEKTGDALKSAVKRIT